MPSFPIFKSFQQQQTTTSTIDQPPTNTRRSSISAIVPPPGNIAGQTSSVFSDHVVHHAQLESVSSSSIAHESPNGRLLRSSSLAAQYSQLPHQSGLQQQGQQQSSWFGTARSVLLPRPLLETSSPVAKTQDPLHQDRPARLPQSAAMPSHPSKTQHQQQESTSPSHNKNAAHGAKAQSQSTKSGSKQNNQQQNQQQESSINLDRAKANKQHHGSHKKSSGSHPLKIDLSQQSSHH